MTGDVDIEAEIKKLAADKAAGKQRNADGTFTAEPLSIDAELRKLRIARDEKDAAAREDGRFQSAKADPELAGTDDDKLRELLAKHPGAYARPHALNVDAPRDWNTGSDMDFARAVRARYGV